VDNWIRAQSQDRRTAAWSEEGPLPSWLAELPGVAAELSRLGIMGWDGRWAPLADGSYLWAAVSGLDGLTRRTVWLVEISARPVSSVGSDQAPHAARSAGLPAGAPPANSAGDPFIRPRDPLARLRSILRRSRVRGL
jgi:hypothetical protein